MKVAVDTNVLLRAIVADEEEQAGKATALLDAADMVAVSLQTLCELVWVLRSAYKVSRSDAAAAIRALLDTRNVVANRPAAQAGLALLDAGGDFADAGVPLSDTRRYGRCNAGGHLRTRRQGGKRPAKYLKADFMNCRYLNAIVGQQSEPFAEPRFLDTKDVRGSRRLDKEGRVEGIGNSKHQQRRR